jgi:uncharacterized membrane-anchored protein
MRNAKLLISCVAVIGAVMACPASASAETAEEFKAKLSFQHGDVALQGGLAQLKLGDAFGYLDAAQARRVLVGAWGNPSEYADGVLGMIFPKDMSPLDEESWGVVITYEEDGYVSDEGAEKIDYTAMLKEMQEDARSANADRSADGYSEMEIVGWAEPPHYDRAHHKLYWAKELKFSDSDENTLNYNIRVLGRRGVLVLNAVGGMKQLASIHTAMEQVLAAVEFKEGHRYTDYIPGKDRAAEYGLAAMVAGGMAAKAGLFKWLLGLVIAMKKFIVVAVVAVVGFLRNLFRGKTQETASPLARLKS